MKPFLQIILVSLISATYAMSQSIYPEINSEIAAGNFAEAQVLIQKRIADAGLPANEIYELSFQFELLDRIRLDFSRDETYVRNALAKYYPALNDAQVQAWEASNELEMKVIEGRKRYFRNAVPNLFRVNAAAKKRKLEIDGVSKSKVALFLQSHLPQVVEAVESQGKARVLPVKFRLTYTLRVEANAVPAGEIIRAWLPFPRSDRKRLGEVKLLSASEKDFIIAPETFAHKSIYMEKTAEKNKPTIFKMSVAYTAFNEWHKIKPEAIKPYDQNSEIFKTFTAERGPHILLTPEIKALARKIVGTETSPLIRARRIFAWMGANIPWASALEYSTIASLPQYCVDNKRGDCGIKSLLFISLCRASGIPAKWQSGWYLYPVGINLHDWSEVYFAGLGWIPVDSDFNRQDIADRRVGDFFFSGADAYRLIVNDDFSQNFFPAKIHPRSETVDFQRGEVEWRGGNLYFDTWDYNMDVEYLAR